MPRASSRKTGTERIALWLMSRTAPREWGQSILGDLEEEGGKRGPFNSISLIFEVLRLSGRFLVERARGSMRPRSSQEVIRPRRGARKGRMLMAWVNDVAYALRTLLRSPGYSLVVVLVLTIGLGANTAVFSVLRTVLIRPLPYPEPDRLVTFYDKIPQFQRYILNSPGSYLEWKESNDVFSEMAAFRGRDAILTGEGPAQQISGMGATASLFPMLNASLLLGRAFTEDEDRPGGDEVVLITEGFWRRRFGADPEVLGKRVQLNGVAQSVVGVLSNRFLFPPPVNLRGRLFQRSPEFFQPLRCDPEDQGTRGLVVLGHLKKGPSVQQARDRLQTVARELARRNSPQEDEAGFGAEIFLLHDQAVGTSRTLLLVLQGAVLLILLIACVNVANLQLVRTSSRLPEMVIRLALGSGRAALIRQLLAESLILAIVGGLAGMAMAGASSKLLVQFGTGRIPRMGPVEIDWLVLVFTFLLATSTGVLFGLLPALQACRPDLTAALSEGGRGMLAGFRKMKPSLLAAAEIALAAALLVSAGLLLRSLIELQKVELGFVANQVFAVPIDLPNARYPDEAAFRTFQGRVAEEVRSIPGVSNVALTAFVPLAGQRARLPFMIEGRAEQAGQIAALRLVSEGYFEALRVPLLRGRTFEERDDENAPLVVIVNRSLAESYWPDSSPVGAVLTLGQSSAPEADRFEIVGVVEDVRHYDLQNEPDHAIYVAQAQSPTSSFSILARTEVDSESFLSQARRRLNRLDPELPVSVQDLEGFVYKAASGHRAPTVLIGVFAGVALSLALIGLYGVMSFLVTQRTQEIGIRMALGADRRKILRLIGGDTFLLVLVGLAFGLAGALGLSRALSGMLYGVAASDPATYVGVAVLFILVAAIAGYIPARRASRVDPIRALRAE